AAHVGVVPERAVAGVADATAALLSSPRTTPASARAVAVRASVGISRSGPCRLFGPDFGRDSFACFTAPIGDHHAWCHGHPVPPRLLLLFLLLHEHLLLLHEELPPGECLRSPSGPLALDRSRLLLFRLLNLTFGNLL